MTLQAGADANETLELSNYGFLYGTFPSAPSVFVFSTQFNIDSALVNGSIDSLNYFPTLMPAFLAKNLNRILDCHGYGSVYISVRSADVYISKDGDFK